MISTCTELPVARVLLFSSNDSFLNPLRETCPLKGKKSVCTGHLFCVAWNLAKQDEDTHATKKSCFAASLSPSPALNQGRSYQNRNTPTNLYRPRRCAVPTVCELFRADGLGIEELCQTHGHLLSLPFRSLSPRSNYMHIYKLGGRLCFLLLANSKTVWT